MNQWRLGSLFFFRSLAAPAAGQIEQRKLSRCFTILHSCCVESGSSMIFQLHHRRFSWAEPPSYFFDSSIFQHIQQKNCSQTQFWWLREGEISDSESGHIFCKAYLTKWKWSFLPMLEPPVRKTSLSKSDLTCNRPENSEIKLGCSSTNNKNWIFR